MSSRKSSAEANEQQPAAYTAAELMAHAERLFGVREEVVRGALGCDTAERYTVEETADRITQFMKAKVK